MSETETIGSGLPGKYEKIQRRSFYGRDYEDLGYKYHPPYSRQELLDILKRHSGKNKECDCSCPYSGNSVEILIQFVFAWNELPQEFTDIACRITRFILSKGCVIGNRLILAAAMVYIAIHADTRCYLRQYEIAAMFYTTSQSLRIHSKAIYFDKYKTTGEFIAEMEEWEKSHSNAD